MSNNNKLRLTAAAGTVTAVAVLGYATPWREVMSSVLNQLGESFTLKVETLRSVFADVGLVEHLPVKGHPHGVAAASRSTGSYFIERFAKEVGNPACYFQCSNSDRRNNRHGSRAWFWAKDCQVTPAKFCPRDRVIAMVDVDQYIDMNQFLTEHFQPTILYTFQPTVVSAERDEYSYCFESDNSVSYKVAGGAQYRHPVWNYNTDVICVQATWAGKSWTNWKNWIPFVTTVYLVDKIDVDPDHQIIGLFPVKRWLGIGAWIARYLEGTPLSRFNPVRGDFMRLRTHTPRGSFVSTGKPGSFLSGNITARQDASLASLSRTLKSGLTLAHVKDVMPDDKLGATIVYEFHSQKLPEACIVTFQGSPGKYVRGYQFSPSEYDSEAKLSLASYMAPLLDAGFCPDVTMPNARKAVEGRITKVRSTSKMSKFIYTTIDEFITLLLIEARVDEYSLGPTSPEVVYERQDKPTQRRILEMAEFVDGNEIGKNFLKREAYGKCADPRIITTINGTTKYRYSRYIYRFSDEVLKVQPWYAFGKKPRQVAERVAQVCLKARTVSNTDFSRFDGTLSEVPRALERLMMIRCFRKEHHQELLELLRLQQNMPCHINVGEGVLKYNSGMARCSGSPETAAFNSIVNAFCAYLAWRMSTGPGGYCSPHEAWNRLGVYGGDDGITPDLNKNTYIKAATRMGLTLEIEPVQRHSHGVKFLSRVYGPLVWNGDITSMCDLPRALSKFHLCVTMPHNVSNVTKLIEKSYAYYLSDKNTPIIGPFVRAVVARLPDQFQFRNIHNVWNAKLETSAHYPNDYLDNNGNGTTPDWMQELVIPGYRCDLLTVWLENAPAGSAGLTYLLSPPNNLIETPVPVVSERVVLDGDIVNPPEKQVSRGNSRPADSVKRARSRVRQRHRSV